jgi:hypothetical protein
MTLPSSPPIYRSWTELVAPIRFGEGLSSHGWETGTWRVYALQTGLKAVGRDTVPDGMFGEYTKKQVIGFQANNGLTADGIAGQLTQRALVKKAATRLRDMFYPRVPEGMMFGIAIKETSGFVGATNDFDPSLSDLGCDCGVIQRRVKGPPYSMETLLLAFDVAQALIWGAVDDGGGDPGKMKGYLPRYDRLTRAQPTLSELTKRKAVIIAHNAPFMYEQFVDHGRLTTPNALAKWTLKPGGGHYTHAEWLEVYTSEVLSFVTG